MAEKIKFYTDTHIAKAVAVQLRQKGVDIVRCEEIGMAEASDTQLLEYATREQRTMISEDSDFAKLHAQWLETGKNHTGIIIVPHYYPVGRLINELMEYHQLIESETGQLENDIYNQIIFLRW